MGDSDKRFAIALRKRYSSYKREGKHIVSVDTFWEDDFDAILEILVQLDHLRELTIHEGVRLREDHCRTLSSLKRIKRLCFDSNEKISLPGFEQLLSGLSLASLDIRLTNRTQEFLSLIGRHTSLKELCLAGSNEVYDEALFLLERLENLEALDLSSTRVQGWGLASLHCPRLRKLLLHHTDAVNEHINTISKWEHTLQYLELSFTFVTGTGLHFLSAFSELSELHIRDCYCGDDDLSFLLGLRKLKALSLSHTGVDKRIVGIVGQLKSLAKLDLFCCRLRPDDIEKIQTALPDCEIESNY